jgi:hypothetical protein
VSADGNSDLRKEDRESSRASPDRDPDPDPDPVERLRRICLALPEVTERVSHGEVSFFVGKQFVALDDHHHGADRLSFWCPAPTGTQEELIACDPVQFFRPPYVGHRGWVGVRIDLNPDWGEIAEIVRDAYCQVAPKRLVARLDPRAAI